MQNLSFGKSYPLSTLQTEILFHNLYNTGKGWDVRQLVCCLPAITNFAALEYAWQQIWQENDVLRTTFEWQNADQPVQHICDNIDLPWSKLDWHISAEDAQVLLNNFLLQDRQQGFKLDQPPLMRLTLIQVGDSAWLVWSFHSILLDCSSLQIILEQLGQIYQSCLNEKKAKLPPSSPRPAHQVFRG